MGTIIGFLAKQGIEECRNEHDARHEKGYDMDAMRHITYQGGVREECATPEAEHHDIEYQLAKVIFLVLDEKRKDCRHQHDHQAYDILCRSIEGFEHGKESFAVVSFSIISCHKRLLFLRILQSSLHIPDNRP